jgi:hypothetical protein
VCATFIWANFGRLVSKLSIDVLTYLMEALPIRMAEKREREKDEIYIKVALMPCKNLYQNII